MNIRHRDSKSYTRLFLSRARGAFLVNAASWIIFPSRQGCVTSCRVKSPSRYIPMIPPPRYRAPPHPPPPRPSLLRGTVGFQLPPPRHTGGDPGFSPGDHRPETCGAKSRPPWKKQFKYWIPLETFSQLVLPLRSRPASSRLVSWQF